MIELRRVTKTYETPAGPFRALQDIDISIGAGEMAAVIGKSGSGKSTLLNLIGGIDRPTTGEVTSRACRSNQSSERALARWRGATVGVVFQFFQLLPTLTVAENVMLPMDFLRARPAKTRRPRALELLDASDSPTRPTSCRRRSRAASSSGWRLRGRSRTIRRS